MQREIVFSAEWDDRAGELRADPSALKALAADSTTRVLAVWRGRPLVAGEGHASLGWLAPGHPVLDHSDADWVFLGRHEGVARFAADVSSWVPEYLDEAAMSGFLDPVEYRHPAAPADHVFAELRGLMIALSAPDATWQRMWDVHVMAHARACKAAPSSS